MQQTPFPTTGYVRINQIVGDPKRGIPALLPLSKTTWWEKCRTDPSWPQPIKLTPRTTAWYAPDVLALVHRLAKGEVKP